jgi:phage terminase large subunit-like protein
MLQFDLRLRASPRQVVTMTPRAVPLLKALVRDASVSMTPMRTDENSANLAQGFVQTISDRYGEMPLGRRELDGAHFRCLISQRRRKNAMRWATNRIQPGGHHDELHRCSIYLGDDVDMVRQDGGRDGRFCRVARLYAAAWKA